MWEWLKRYMKPIKWEHPKSQVTFRRPSLSPRVCTEAGRSYGDVITKLSRLDGLPIFLTNGDSLAPFARWSSANMFPLSHNVWTRNKICVNWICRTIFRVSSWRHLQVYLVLWVKDTLGDVWHAGKLICSFILRLTLAQKGSLSLSVVSLLVMRATVDMITAYVVHCRWLN